MLFLATSNIKYIYIFHVITHRTLLITVQLFSAHTFLIEHIEVNSV